MRWIEGALQRIARRADDSSLRAKLTLIVISGAIVPLVMGLAATSIAARAGERLVRDKLLAALARDTASIRERWEYRFSDISIIGTDPSVAAALAAAADGQLIERARVVSESLFAQTKGVQRIEFLDRAGAIRWVVGESFPQFGSLDEPPGKSGPAGPDRRGRVWTGIEEPLFPGRSSVVDSVGNSVGSARGWVRLAALLSGERTGSPDAPFFALIDRENGDIMSSSDMSELMRTRKSFRSSGQEWVTESVSLDSPPVDIIVAASIDPFVTPFRRAATASAAALVGGTLIALVLAGMLTRRVTATLSRVAAAADAIAAGDLETRVDASGNDEVGRVARAVNVMTGNLRRLLRELTQREALATVGEFAAQLAHEVRNPLTSIRVDLQRLRRSLPSGEHEETLARALDQVQRLNNAVTGALSVTQSARLAQDNVNISAVLRQAARVAEPAFMERRARQELQLDIPADVTVTGDAGALERMFVNILLNAADALAQGGRVILTARMSETSIVIGIEDDGAGMNPTTLSRATEAFFTTKANGTGLGLVIVRRVLEAHRGTLDITSAERKGTTVTIALPRVRAQSATASQLVSA
jgi:signal transduction histidine kinase